MCWSSGSGFDTASTVPLGRAIPLPPGFVPPCLPTKAPRPPTGDAWLHEIKHDGFRVVARKDGGRVRLYSRPGNDLTYRFTLIVEALVRLRSRSCIIDGEAGDDGVPSFDRIRYRRHDASVLLYAFDLIELNGDDLCQAPFETRAQPAALACPSRLRRRTRGGRVLRGTIDWAGGMRPQPSNPRARGPSVA